MGEWMRREYRSECRAKGPQPVFSQEDACWAQREVFNQAGNGVHHEGHEEHEGWEKVECIAGGALLASRQWHTSGSTSRM